MELVVGKRFVFDKGLGLHPSVNKTDYKLVYIDPVVSLQDNVNDEKYVVRIFRKGSNCIQVWDATDFEDAIEI